MGIFNYCSLNYATRVVAICKSFFFSSIPGRTAYKSFISTKVELSTSKEELSAEAGFAFDVKRYHCLRFGDELSTYLFEVNQMNGVSRFSLFFMNKLRNNDTCVVYKGV